MIELTSLRVSILAKALGLVLLAAMVSPTQGADSKIDADLLIVGATESGWAAAVQAARLGVPSIAIVHDGRWIGGQFTEQALACVDENKGVGKVGWGVDWHPMKRSFHRSGLFKELMDRIEAFNTRKYGSPMPGRPYHGPSTFRPVEAEAVFREMLQPYLETGQVRLFVERYPVRADVNKQQGRPRLTGLRFARIGSETPDLHVTARITIDASDWGDAIQVVGAAFECGPDPQSRYGEPSAPIDLSGHPANEMNPITWAMIIVESDGETPIARPSVYDRRNYVRTSRLSLAAMKDLEWDRPVRLSSILHWPEEGMQSPRQLSVYTVRRVVDGTTSKQGRTIILLNYMLGQDYPLERLPQRVVNALEATEQGASTKNVVLMSRAQREVIYEDAKQHALGVLYHLQQYVHDRASDTANSLRNFELSDEFGTPDRLPPKPYIRESLRLKAMYMMREQDGRNADGETKDAARERFARVTYPDGVLAWQFHYDFHRTGRAYLRSEGRSGPWIDAEKPGRHTRHVSDRATFPLRSLIPVEMDGLLGAQKNVGYSSIVSAAVRLHDQCIAVGQAAGATAAVALRQDVSPREIPFDRSLLEQVRHALCGEIPEATPLLIWPFRDLPADHAAFVAVNRLAARGGLPLDPREVDFRPDAPAVEEWKRRVVEHAMSTKESTTPLRTSAQPMTRGEFCRVLWEQISGLPDRPFVRQSDTDADLDGIPDLDDPTPFTPAPPVRWAIEPPPPERDGRPDPDLFSAARERFNFAGADAPAVEGCQSEVGLPFDGERGFGWSRDLSGNHRRRRALEGIERDTFLFTRDRDRWECVVPNGLYRITVCVGDSAYPQTEQRVTVEGTVLVDNESTASGTFFEASDEVVVEDGRLTVDIGSGRPGSNTCLNWLLWETL